MLLYVMYSLFNINGIFILAINFKFINFLNCVLVISQRFLLEEYSLPEY